MTAAVPHVLVTGANGFVGRAVVSRLRDEAMRVREAVRSVDTSRHGSSANAVVDTGRDVAAVGDLVTASWHSALQGIDAVVHCAARVHMLHDDAPDALAAFRSINRDASARLAMQAAAAGVARFIYISSIGVNGAQTEGRPFTAADRPAPHSPYAISKHEAEQTLTRIAGESAMGMTIIRPPLVYGPGAPGNFHTLLRAVRAGIPLPLGAIDNKRSFVALDNLVDLIRLVVTHGAAPGKTLLVSDGEDLSTTDLLRRAARAMGRTPRLIPVPPRWIEGGLRLLGREQLAQRLFASLQIDIDATCRELGWRPPVSIDAALVRTAQQFLAPGA